MHRAYKSAIVYFFLFSLLLLLSAGMLFWHKTGLTLEGVEHYYLGDATKFVVARTTMGVLKTTLQHLFSFGLFGFVLLHFLRFIPYKNYLRLLIIALLVVSFLEIASGFCMLWFSSLFAYLKIITFFSYFLLVLYTFFLLMRTIFIHQKDL
jgi:hypothetical protein